jgi:hypothetical protein
MAMTRRDFLQASLATLAACTAPRTGAPGGSIPSAGRHSKILILGGTGFLGPALVEAARARGDEVTLFNRGKTNPGRFTDVEQLHGDRDGQLDALGGRKWDVAIDTSGYVPRIVKLSAALLAPSVERYVFVSSISAYDESVPPGSDEDAKIAQLSDPASEDVRASYGALKAACERAAEAAIPGRTTMRGMLDECQGGIGSKADLVWVPWPFLEKEKVEPWGDMPVWIPAGTAESGMSQVSIARAVAAGLRFRPISDTARDTLAWWKALPPERRAKLRAGLSPEREKAVLAAWAA